LKAKPKTFLVRQRASYDRQTWQIGQDVIGDAAYYTLDFATRCFDKLVKRGLTPIYEDGATAPNALPKMSVVGKAA
jgi:hypothetical protein